MNDGPLTGLRVIDAGTMIAGPLAATHLADFGADVIKIEQPLAGDPLRQWAPVKNGVGLWWKVIARNKRLITLSLSAEEGKSLLRRLVETSDVLIENYRPGTFERWGLGYEELSAINPGLVFVRVSGFGQTGPYRHRGGFGTIAESFSGVAAFTGFPDGPPTLPAFPLADSVAATFAAMAAMFALYRRDHHAAGRGQEIDVSLYEPLFRLVEAQVIGYDQLGLIKKRKGNRLEEDAPRNLYQTRDGRWIAVSGSAPRTYTRLVEAMGMPELAADERFATVSSRVANADALDAILADWFRRHEFGDIMPAFERAEVVAGPVLNIREIFEEPHYRARENIVEVPDADFGTVRMQSVVPRFCDTPGRVRHSGGGLGQDNDDIYGLELGLDEAARERLRALKVI